MNNNYSQLGGPTWAVSLGRRDSTTASAHTIGKARCTTFRSRIYKDTNIDSSFATSLQANCFRAGDNDNLSPLDTTTENLFGISYFKNLVNKIGPLHSDQQLFNGGSTDSLVQTYSNPLKFKTDFANAMIKMGKLSSLTGNDGQIRTKCYQVNK
ncbi:Cationic peroxidase 1, partial [Mucuna pruriens]